MAKGHLITCVSKTAYNEFIECGYVALGPFPPKTPTSDSGLRAGLRINWDVIADLKRVEEGDYCFLHARRDQTLYGPFRLGSYFFEMANLPTFLRSANLTFDVWSQARDRLTNITYNDYSYRAVLRKPANIGIRSAPLMEIFLRQALGKVNSIPPRFQYGDTKKVVKPLLHYEIRELCSILGVSLDEVGEWKDCRPGVEEEIKAGRPIRLDLELEGGEIAFEKVLEAWVMNEMRSAQASQSQLLNLIGEFDYFGNAIYTYYTNFLDVIAYTAVDETPRRCEHCGSATRNLCEDARILELKKGYLSGEPKEISQLRTYMDWCREILGENAHPEGYLVAASYSEPYLERACEVVGDDVVLLQYTASEDGDIMLEAVNL